MQIKCDNCGSSTDRIIPETATDGDLEYTFFRCPDCGAAYPVAVTDADLRNRIAEYVRRQQQNRMKRQSEQFLRETEELKQKNIIRTRELMELHPLALFLQPTTAE